MTTASKTGFTLLEALIYIALLGLIFGGLMTSAFIFIDSSQWVLKQMYVSQEADFLVDKFNWLLSQSHNVTVPIISSPTSSEISLLTDDATVLISWRDNKLGISSETVPETVLSPSHVQVSNFFVDVQTLPSQLGKHITITFTLTSDISPGRRITLERAVTKYFFE